MNETDLNEQLNRANLWDVAHGSGVYALELDVPDIPAAIRERWLAVHDVIPAEDLDERLARASTVAYVGAASDVYDRLTDHVAGEVRQSALLEVFSAVKIIDIWPYDNPRDGPEFNTARRLADRDGTVAWMDGRLFG